LRKAQAVVARPAEATNWTPAAAGPPVVPAPDRSVYAASYAPTYPPVQPSSIAAPAPTPVQTRSLPDYNTPPPAFGAGQSQQPGLPFSQAQPQPRDADTRSFPTVETSSFPTVETRSFPTIDNHDKPTLVNEQIRPAQPPAWGEPSEPSWLVGPAASAASAGPVVRPASELAVSEPVASIIEPGQSSGEYAAQLSREDSAPDVAEAPIGEGTIPCPNCGTTLQSDAYFCTECGARVKS
jgi:hypothetical protein